MKTKQLKFKSKLPIQLILFGFLWIQFLSASPKKAHLLNNQTVQSEKATEIDPVFNTKKFYYEELLNSFFRGDFIKIPFDRDDQFFSIILNTYLNTYAQKCASSLPDDKIEMTVQECVTESVTTNGYGMETGRNCVEWINVGTGLYASPKMYNAKMTIEKQQARDVLKIIFGTMTQKDPLGNALTLVKNVQTLKTDINTLLNMNGCESLGIKRFEENLRLFALNKLPIKLGENSAKSPLSISKNQNFTKLIEDLVYLQSKKWVMNRYHSNSVSNANVLSKDANGFPTKIKANYIYQGMNGRTIGSVTLTLVDGLPECIYFYDAPSSCRTPDRVLISKYAEGQYQN